MVANAHSKTLQNVYGAKNNDELAAAYDQWANEYDQDVFKLGYTFPSVAAGYFGRYIETGSTVIDAGAGTGIIGEILVALEYKDIVGFDLSNGMLELARKRECYSDLKQMVLGEKLDFKDNQFDAGVAIGVFTAGHAPASGLDEMTRIIRPGGHMVFTIRDDVYEHQGFKEHQQQLEKDGAWKLIKMSPSFNTFSTGERDIVGRVFVYEITR